MENEFEFGNTRESKVFFDENPHFYPSFEQLMALTNKCFGRQIQFWSRAQDVCFNLGDICRDDFLEIMFLAVHGFAIAASKLLRSLYERAVTLAYITKYPEKAERFVRFAAVQEYKAMRAALKISSEEQFNSVIKRTTTTQITEAYELMKSEFKRTACNKCKRQDIAISWDIDLAAMVEKVGDPFDKYYLAAYVMTNLDLHTTLASTFHKNGKDVPVQRTEARRAKARYVLFNAMLILIPVIRCQNTLSGLGLDPELSACEQGIFLAWQSPAEQQ